MCWNISGFTLCIIAAGASVQSVADIVSVYLWFLLFSFAGLLILPVLNRQSVFALDQHFSNAHSHLELREAITDVDRITDQDPTRSPRLNPSSSRFRAQNDGQGLWRQRDPATSSHGISPGQRYF